MHTGRPVFAKAATRQARLRRGFHLRQGFGGHAGEQRRGRRDPGRLVARAAGVLTTDYPDGHGYVARVNPCYPCPSVVRRAW